MRPTPETDAAWSCFKGYMEPLQDVKDLSRKLERERDEARKESEYYKERYEQLKDERDEARAVADELVAIATRYLGWHLSRTPMEPDDDHLAQSRKITEAIARWKSLGSA